MRPGILRVPVPAAVAERIKLFHIAQIELGLVLHPAPEAHIHGAVLERVERAEGQGIPLPRRAHHQGPRLGFGDGHDGRVETHHHCSGGVVKAGSCRGLLPRHL